MYPEQPDENRESIVMPLFDVVVYPKSRAKFLADKVTGETLLNDMPSRNISHTSEER